MNLAFLGSSLPHSWPVCVTLSARAGLADTLLLDTSPDTRPSSCRDMDIVERDI